MVTKCFEGVCFVPLDPNSPKFFGFSEFLTGLALMVLAWTIADVRYRFRIQTTPISLQSITFGVVAAVGVLTLLTDLWRAQGWLVLDGTLLTQALWQALLAGFFLLTFLTWTWFAFIRPPKFGKRNAERYARTLYQYVIKGAPAELSVIADELTRSAKSLVNYAPEMPSFRNQGEDNQRPTASKVQGFANDTLLILGDRRLCRAIVESSPGTALAVFLEIGNTHKYRIPVHTFAKNIMNEALINKDSFLYHETDGYSSGIVGYLKPLSQAMFSNFIMVETIGTMLDPDVLMKSQKDVEILRAYCRVVLITFRDYVEQQFFSHSFVLYRAKGYIENATWDLYKLNGLPNILNDESIERLRIVVNFIEDAIKILDKKATPEGFRLRVKRRPAALHETFYDHLANMLFAVIFNASAVTFPFWECWLIQYTSIWSRIFGSLYRDLSAWRIVMFKLRRLLYDEIADMNRFPNFKGAKILGFCLNVMGLASENDSYHRESRALHKAVLTWTRKNYVWLHNYNTKIAEACLVDGITYDIENHRLVKSYPADGLRREPSHIYLTLDRTLSQPKVNNDSGDSTLEK